MLPRRYYSEAASMVATLLERQRKMGLSDKELGRLTSQGHSLISKWRLHDRQPTLRSFIAVADVLGLKIELVERIPPAKVTHELVK